MEKSKVPRADLKLTYLINHGTERPFKMTLTQYALRSAEWLKKRVFH